MAAIPNDEVAIHVVPTPVDNNTIPLVPDALFVSNNAPVRRILPAIDNFSAGVVVPIPSPVDVKRMISEELICEAMNPLGCAELFVIPFTPDVRVIPPLPDMSILGVGSPVNPIVKLLLLKVLPI
jgi:hypothetical protein